MDGNGIGILVSSADGARIGIPGQSGNLISGNTVGIELSGATNAQVLGNAIGISPAATPFPTPSTTS